MIKVPVVTIPLVYFGSIFSGLIGAFFGAISSTALLHNHSSGFFVASSLILAITSAATICCSIGLFLRRARAQRCLIYLMATIAVTLLAVFVHGFWIDHSNRVFSVFAAPCLIGVVVLNATFLLNAPLVKELSRAPHSVDA